VRVPDSRRRASAGIHALTRTAAIATAVLFATVTWPATAAQPASIQRERGSGLEARFVAYPWRPDLFQALEEGAETARSWALARLAVSSYFTLDGTRLEPGQFAVVLNPRTGVLPMTLELRRVDNREFLLDPPATAPAPPGETVYKRPVTFAAGAEPTPVLDLTIASWSSGCQLTIRYGNRKLVKELPRTSP
jgi:hypothetical protein